MSYYVKAFIATFLMLFSLSSCANHQSYNITEQQIAAYIQAHIDLDKRLSIPGIVDSRLLLSNIEVGIGRISEDRVHIKAHADGTMRIFNQEQQGMQTVFSFSAIPYYNREDNAIYLKQLQLESIQITPFSLGELGQDLAQISLPVFNLFLENEAIYQLDADNFSGLILEDHRITLVTNNQL